ncbi:MAG: acyl-CoA thioesterase, partial [Parachlamydiaceae bacterium]|nr:acyl-CoA thioesterase [Parachlamydiaceae bacterium]
MNGEKLNPQSSHIYRYEALIEASDLDSYGHVNNSRYFSLLEDARWDLITNNGYGKTKVDETGLGPIVLEVNLRYLKELFLNDKIVIETKVLSTAGKPVIYMQQKIVRGKDICCEALFTLGLFDLNKRKLARPSEAWLKALNCN